MSLPTVSDTHNVGDPGHVTDHNSLAKVVDAYVTESPLTPLRYGAAGNGTTDDTAAVQDALNAAGPLGEQVYLPAGYLFGISNTLLWQPSADSGSAGSTAPSIVGPTQGKGGNDTDSGGNAAASGFTCLSDFPQGQFVIDYIGGASSGLIGFTVRGFMIYNNNLGAGVRGYNCNSDTWKDITQRFPWAPSPTNTIGSPMGAFSLVASSTNSPTYNSVVEGCHVKSTTTSGYNYHFNTGDGGFLHAYKCSSENSPTYGFYAGNNTTLVGCIDQYSVGASFAVGLARMVGCATVDQSEKGNCVYLLGAGTANKPAEIVGCSFIGSKTTGGGAAEAMVNMAAAAQDAIFSGCHFYTGTETSYYAYVPASTTGNVLMNGCSFNQTQNGALLTTPFYLGSSGVLKVVNSPGVNPAGLQTAPSITSGTPVANPFPFPCTVQIQGGTVSAIAKNATTLTGMTSGMLRLDVGESMTVTYSAAPTCYWFGE